MNSEHTALLAKIRSLEEELEQSVNARRSALRMRIHNGKVAFEQAIEQRQRELKVHVLHYVIGARPLILLTAPFIYAVIVPFALLDLFVTLYQAVCFPVYGIEKVKRSDYLIFDRTQLRYLNVLEKFNCAYCSYANGLIAYVREIAGRTEQYWCPIKHAKRLRAPHEHYRKFFEFGDAEAYRSELDSLRGELRTPKSQKPLD